VYVIRGEATEIGFKPSGVGLLIPDESKRLRSGEITISVDSDAHLVGNFASPAEELVTLHCYSPPLTRMQVFNESETFFADYPSITANAATSGFYNVNL
jgi:cysteine dioxygenase